MMLELQINDASFCFGVYQRCLRTVGVEKTAVKVSVFDSSFLYREERPKGRAAQTQCDCVFPAPSPRTALLARPLFVL